MGIGSEQDIAALLRSTVRTVADFPKPGINFYDVTPFMLNPAVFAALTDEFVRRFPAENVDAVVGIDARGFIFGAALALKLGRSFVPVRKAGKLPAAVERINYALEYGEGQLEIHKDALIPGQRTVIVDDLLATGGTAKAAGDLVCKLGAHVVGYGFVVELAFLKGAAKLKSPVISLLKCDS
ncbi:MAG: adenine phosphoribosyltransferase [Oligoflexia bacterium]|nr:adenine phosphoribosyltransferase [Oligoflexia bacterium]